MYSIGEVSKLMGLSISTLRYYDKTNIITNVKRNESGIRMFDEKDIQSIKVIECLKASGMQLKDIKIFMQWCDEGDSTLNQRLEMFYEQEKAILDQLALLNNALDMIKYKQWYYSTAVNDKTEKKVKQLKKEEMPKDIRLLYESTH